MVSVTAFLLVFHWPANNDPARMLGTFSPAKLAQTFDMVRLDKPFCEGPSYPDGTCTVGQTSGTFSAKPARRNAWSPDLPAGSAEQDQASEQDGPPSAMPGMVMVLFLFGLVAMSVFAPEQLKRLMGVVEAKPGQAGRPRREKPSVQAPASYHELPPAAPPPPSLAPRPAGGGFGRKRV